MEFCWINTGRKVGGELWKGSEGQRGFLTQGVYFFFDALQCHILRERGTRQNGTERFGSAFRRGAGNSCTIHVRPVVAKQGFISPLSWVSNSLCLWRHLLQGEASLLAAATDLEPAALTGSPRSWQGLKVQQNSPKSTGEEEEEEEKRRRDEWAASPSLEDVELLGIRQEEPGILQRPMCCHGEVGVP